MISVIDSLGGITNATKIITVEPQQQSISDYLINFDTIFTNIMAKDNEK
jgi:hypothetical protein